MRRKNMSVMITIEMPVIPEKLEEYLGILKQALVDTRAYKGCQSVATYVEQANSNVVLVEEWDSVEDQQAYMSWRAETGLLDAIVPFMRGELVQRTFDLKSDV